MLEARPLVRPTKLRAAILTTAFLAVSSIALVALTPPPEARAQVLPLVFFILVPAFGVLLTLAAFGPRRIRYRVGDGALTVETLFGRQRWPLAGAKARTYTPGRLWRVGGTAMPGYFTGRYREGGRFTRVYATDVTSPMVLIDAGEVRVLVNPADAATFLAALRAEGAHVD